MELRVLVALATVFVSLPSSYQQSCLEPVAANLQTVIALLIPTGDAAVLPQSVNVSDFHVVCRVHDNVQGLLQAVSVVVHYTCSGHSNCPPGTAVEQIESGCESGQWSNIVEGSTSFTRSQTTEASLSTTAREDCSACVSPELASELGITTDSVTHCVACNSACDQGLMRCFGPGASDCCNFYNNSVCVEQCPSPFLSNSDSICVCPEGKTGHNCEDVVDCGGLLAPASGLVNVSTTVFNSTATYSCNDGYSLEGDSTRTCLASGLWSGRSPQCTVVDCGVLVDPTSGAVTLSNTTFTSSATYSCNDGYSLVGDSTRTCLASGLWSGIAPNCTVVDCGGLPDPENGAATAADTIFNSTATFSCNDGYNLVGEETRRCLASGSWSGSAPNCTEIDCGDLFDPTNGGVSVTSKRFNSTATYTCDSGYNLVGDTARTCLATASWSSFEPSCIVVSCGGLADPENGAVEVFDTTFTSTATYSCNDGYSLVGDTTRTCEASGLWSGTAPLCTVVDCGALEDPANGSVAVSDTTFNSTSSYSCSVGYSLDGESPRTCLATGLWSGSTPTCTVVDCGSLADPAFGEVRISDTTFASTATYTCSDGYSLVGDTTRTCLASGLWSGDEPTCTGHAIGSSCPAITQTDVERVLSSYVAEQTSCSGQTNCPPQITIIDMYINCLSSGPLRDTYTHTTVTVLYMTIGMQYLAQADIGCSNSTSSWEASVLRYIASSLDQVFVVGNGTENEDTRTSCSACLSPQLATELGTTSDSIYHCVGCDDVCSATGAGLCYGPSPTECCSYYSPSNVCMSNCGPRRTYNSQWQCICASFWREPDCTVCDLSCENGGTPDVLGCTACHCPAGYSGTHCGGDIDECSTSETCSVNGVCTNSAGGFSCSCFAGYTGGRCQINIDECSEGTHDCLNGATCIDEAPGYRCSCREGTGGQKCESCVLSGCDTCATEKDPVLCTQCGLGYFLNNGYCEKFCGVENCLKCSETSSSVCEECQNGYVLSREGGLCNTKTDPTFSTGTSERGDRVDESGNESGLSDFVIAAILAGVIIFVILLITLLTCMTVSVVKRACRGSDSEPTDKYNDVQRAIRRKANPAYVRSSYMEAEVEFGAVKVETTETIDTVEDGGSSEGEEGEEGEEEYGGEGDTVPLSEV